MSKAIPCDGMKQCCPNDAWYAVTWKVQYGSEIVECEGEKKKFPLFRENKANYCFRCVKDKRWEIKPSKFDTQTPIQ